MKQHTFNRLAVAGFAVALLGLAGCTSTVSRGVNDEGKADEIIFPEIDKTSGIDLGIFPNIENLKKISNGMHKDDLYYLIGRPHFRETHGAREWDYVMKFREVVNGPVTVCQYKVIFDKEMRGQSFYWKPADCSRFLGEKPAPAPAPAPKKVYTLKGDTLFKFDKSGLGDMLPGGKEELDRLSRELQNVGPNARMTVFGHTDRLGSDAYNMRLSQERANTVRQYLITKGLPGAQMRAVGLGETQPVVQCSQSNHAALVSCLQPNRRVEVEVTGAQQ